MMRDAFCVRADSGQYTDHFIRGGYAAIGWFEGLDLSACKTKEDLLVLYPEKHPWDTSRTAIGVNIGQIGRFLFEIQKGDLIFTPARENEFIRCGMVQGPYYFAGAQPEDGCRYPHRRPVSWQEEAIRRHELDFPLQATLKSTLTVFRVRNAVRWGESVEEEELAETHRQPAERVLERVLTLDPTEFEILVTALLATLGFEAERVGKTGDEGVDATGLLDVYNLAKIQLFVQAKRYRRGSRISGRVVRSLR